MAKVKLATKWNGHKKGDVVEVGDYTARQLVTQKIGEEVAEKAAKKEAPKEGDKKPATPAKKEGEAKK